jgi:hypothetical protein
MGAKYPSPMTVANGQTFFLAPKIPKHLCEALRLCVSKTN